MNGYQFYRIEAYGRSGSNCGKPSRKRGVKAEKTGGKWSLSQILDEAERVDGACPHVEKPEVPVLLPGSQMTPRQFLAYAEKQAEGAKDASGRKLRVDAVIAVAGVASFPISASSIKYDPEARAAYDLWEETLLKFLKLEYGDMLKCALRHTDEGHWHVHFYVCEDKAPDGTFGVRNIHPGRRAKEDARKKGGNIRKMDDAYDAAMEKVLDRYWEHVANLCDQERMGPLLYRSDRWSWVKKQLKSIYLRDLEEQIKESNKKLIRRIDMAEAEKKAAIEYALVQQKKDHERQMATLVTVIETIKAENDTLKLKVNQEIALRKREEEEKVKISLELAILRAKQEKHEQEQEGVGGMSL